MCVCVLRSATAHIVSRFFFQVSFDIVFPLCTGLFSRSLLTGYFLYLSPSAPSQLAVGAEIDMGPVRDVALALGEFVRSLGPYVSVPLQAAVCVTFTQVSFCGALQRVAARCSVVQCFWSVLL